MQYLMDMIIARSRVTAQGQISVPAEVRSRLGIGPGSVLEWKEDDDNKVVVERSTRYTSEQIHQEIFDETPPPRPLKDLKEGIRSHIRKRHACD
jgi:AbrB family looped-hinge helix DNA binding protein